MRNVRVLAKESQVEFQGEMATATVGGAAAAPWEKKQELDLGSSAGRKGRACLLARSGERRSDYGGQELERLLSVEEKKGREREEQPCRHGGDPA